jgi:hypothetical protein
MTSMSIPYKPMKNKTCRIIAKLLAMKFVVHVCRRNKNWYHNTNENPPKDKFKNIIKLQLYNLVVENFKTCLPYLIKIITLFG